MICWAILAVLGVASVKGSGAIPASLPSGIAVLPATIYLSGARSSQRVVVEAAGGRMFQGDVTAKAHLTSGNVKVATVESDGTVHAVSDGETTISAISGGRRATAAVHITGAHSPVHWSFRNHVLPMLTRVGCNSGACHGAAAGKGGLKLSLRGFDPQSDFDVLVRQSDGRRVISGDPRSSLMLLKPTMGVPHGGGLRIPPGSADYHVLAGWIASGTPPPTDHDPRIKALEVFPPTSSLHAGQTQQIVVRADYSDGHTEDVTQWVKFGTSDSSVATVDDGGNVRVLGSGESAITVWFSSHVTFARVVSPFPGTAAHRPAGRTAIDRMIDSKLAALHIPASPLASDATFLRRAFLDAAGILPTPAETTAFLADTSPTKRSKLVDALLKRPEFVDYWTHKWSDLFLVSSRKMPVQDLDAFYAYIHKSVADNKPWNTFAREILTAQGSTLDNGAANYYLIHKDPIDLAETTTQCFLGMSLMCAHCHNHPLEKWTQRDYYQFANLFSRVRLKNGDRPGEVMVLASDQGDISHPRLGVPLPPRPLDGAELALNDTHDRRGALADWLTAPENRYFAKALVNRVWRNFMGRGLVEAEDDIRLTNPPSNQELLDFLAQGFVASGYDVRRLTREIMLTDAYQRSAATVGVNARDVRFYSHYIVRRLPAEVILDAVSQITGIPTVFAGYPAGTRALQLRDSQVASYFLTAFGRPDREKTCACERQQATNVAQALHLSNGDTVNDKLRAPKGAIDKLLDGGATDAQALDALYVAALARHPSAEEQSRALHALTDRPPDAGTPVAASAQAPPAAPDRRMARHALLEDLFWAVLTDRDFLFNH